MAVSVAHCVKDLLLEVNNLAKDGKFDYLVIESTGISEPLPVAETFTFADEDGVSLSDVATLDTMVTVVDAVNFLKDFDEAKVSYRIPVNLWVKRMNAVWLTCWLIRLSLPMCY
jgi:G3E family GTPase